MKHDGERYVFSPYILIWNNDQYYVVGFSDKHNTITKFRVDRMTTLEILNDFRVQKPDNFDISEFFEKEFSMLHGDTCEVELLCENQLMDSIIDKFGTKVHTDVVDDEHFRVIVNVDLGGTFYGWVFASGGKMRIVEPIEAVERFEQTLKNYVRR